MRSASRRGDMLPSFIMPSMITSAGPSQTRGRAWAPPEINIPNESSWYLTGVYRVGNILTHHMTGD